MPDYLSILAALGASLLVLVAVAWAVVLLLLLRGSRSGSAAGRAGRTLSGLPRQRQEAPHVESVELTPAEQDAFAGLVRQLGRR
ncbi:hypothetical protein ACFC09_32770 [Streptomyces sp. NPDC056161]|uniref:hypothetical protein n=1 Tax=Streptomyces sp. NPDC056161 TaxID=3345732 RepID=UPI0035DE5DFE